MDLRRFSSVLFLLLLLPISARGAADDKQEPPKLLGRCTAADLEQEPFSEWFTEGYGQYEPNAGVLDALRRAGTGDVGVQVFFGTWCGDSHREVPRWLKLTDAIGLPRERVELVAVDGTEEATKRSPDGEERGVEVYRVPTIVIRRGANEVARIVEHPVLSLERDLLAILEGRSYRPNYRSYPTVRRWLQEGLLADANVSPRGLAGEIRQLVSGEGELAAAANVMLSRGDTAESVKLNQVNCALHRESTRCHARLAGALLKAGDTARARESAEQALRLNEDPERVESLVGLIERSTAEASTDQQQAGNR